MTINEVLGWFVSDPRSKGGLSTLLTEDEAEARAHAERIKSDGPREANFFRAIIFEQEGRKTWRPS